MTRTPTAPRAALWFRVSKEEEEIANQHADVRALCRHRGYRVVREFSSEESAWSGQPREFAQVERAARLGEFDVLVVWALDRVTRKGAEAMLRFVRRFEEWGVAVVSVQEPWVDTSPEIRELLLSIAGWAAQQESARKSARVKAAIRRRTAEGHHHGRVKGQADAKKRKTDGYRDRWSKPGERERQRERMRAWHAARRAEEAS